MKHYPRWQIYLKRLWLFLGIVWREWGEGRLSIKTSWEIAGIIWP
jgi:hypothetical protein